MMIFSPLRVLNHVRIYNIPLKKHICTERRCISEVGGDLDRAPQIQKLPYIYIQIVWSSNSEVALSFAPLGIWF